MCECVHNCVHAYICFFFLRINTFSPVGMSEVHINHFLNLFCLVCECLVLLNIGIWQKILMERER